VIFQHLSWELVYLGTNLTELVQQLKRDPWRELNPFSTDVRECNTILFNPARSRGDKALTLDSWLSDNQPCLFGRHAAKQGWLTYCLIDDIDLSKGDEHVQGAILTQRDRWKADARVGKKHGFIILIISEAIANAEPSPALLEICKRLCQLYLSRSETQTPLLDELVLDIDSDTTEPESRIWKVGVNWFGAQADQRWWHDHRIPGGVGLSMNSVGHMARRLAEEAIKRNSSLAAELASVQRDKLVTWALPVAMRTILTASGGAHPGTRLKDRGDVPLPEGMTEEDRNRALHSLCPFNEDEYFGWYDTDATILPEYFEPQHERSRKTELTLPFTYLHRNSDADYMSMGFGEAIDPELGSFGTDDSEPLR